MRSALSPLALVMLLVACSASHGAAGAAGDGGGAEAAVSEIGSVDLVPCDPLAAKPITLGAIVGVGADGTTLYVDAANGVFVSSADGKLVRQHVIGSGSSGTTELLITFEAPGADPSTARDLLVELTGAQATAMALGPTSSRAFLDQNPPGTTPLALQPASTVAGLPVVNTSNAISYVADVSNGDVLVATTPLNPDDAAANAGLAIFYGPPAAMYERPVTSFEQTDSGNGTLTFLVDDTSYTLTFGRVSAPDAGPFGVFALMGLSHGAVTLGVTLRSPTPTTPPTDLAFSCFGH